MKSGVSSVSEPGSDVAPEPTVLERAINDIGQGALQWRIWSVLAMFDMRARYRRSKLGQFWVTISMAVTICALALVYSAIFKVAVSEYLPWVAVSFTVWGLIASLINDGATVFIDSENYLRSSSLPKSMYIFRMLARVTLTFAHNLVLVPIVLLIFLIPPTWASLLFLPAFLLAVLNGFSIALVLGTLCARYRDLPPVVSSIVQVAFFVSPVMWGRAQLGADHHVLIDWNPFAVFLELMREPLLGNAPEGQKWWVALGITIVGLLFSIPFFARFRARIAYYI